MVRTELAKLADVCNNHLSCMLMHHSLVRFRASTRTFLCVCITPFGLPVEPEVYRSIANWSGAGYIPRLTPKGFSLGSLKLTISVAP